MKKYGKNNFALKVETPEDLSLITELYHKTSDKKFLVMLEEYYENRSI